MSTIIEEFRSKEDCEERRKELEAKGHRPFQSSTQKPVEWRMSYELRYHPENRSRKKAKRQHARAR